MDVSEQAVFCVYTEMQLVLSLLYFRKVLQPRAVEAHFVLFRTSTARFSTIDVDQLPGTAHCFKNDLNESVILPDLSFMQILSLPNVRYVAYPNSPFLSHELVANAFSAGNDVTRILISDGASFYNFAPPAAKLKFTLYYIFRRFFNRIPHLSRGLLRDTRTFGDADVVITHEKLDGVDVQQVAVRNLLAEPGSLKDIIVLFGDSSALIEKFRSCAMIFFGQPRLAGGIVESEYWEILGRIAQFARQHNRPLVIKPHPAEDAGVYGRVLGGKVTLVDTKVPAEVLLAQLQDIIVLSFFSSVSLLEHDASQKHIWLKGMMAADVKIRGSAGIVTVDSVKELVTELTLGTA